MLPVGKFSRIHSEDVNLGSGPSFTLTHDKDSVSWYTIPNVKTSSTTQDPLILPKNIEITSAICGKRTNVRAPQANSLSGTRLSENTKNENKIKITFGLLFRAKNNTYKRDIAKIINIGCPKIPGYTSLKRKVYQGDPKM